jgi:FAD/FMN-containing dehydrogenase
MDGIGTFDRETGRLTVGAGALLADILARFAPLGYFPPVVPGTKHVTIGGMIAADVHGKNHHCDGGFGNFVESLLLATSSGDVVRCSPAERPETFLATVGGMGLTGTILEATFRMRRIETAWMRQRTIAVPDLDAALTALNASATYSVAWIDGLARAGALGRSLVFLAEHATRAEIEALRPARQLFQAPAREWLAVPFQLPSFTSSFLSVRAFNDFYYRRGALRSEPFFVHWNPYFFPLDRLGAWNRIYGRRGFLQHQCVVPEPDAPAVLRRILVAVSESGNASFLAVLKRLGSGTGLLSFPMPGYTLALDFPAVASVFDLLDRIDRIVVEAGGRLYLAKDARQSRSTFEAGYPQHARFRRLRESIGAAGHFSSRLSMRLGI